MKSYFSQASNAVLQILGLATIIALALGINYLSAWTGPAALPPNSNVSAPLNIGTTNQVKDANLSVGHSTNTATDYGLVSYGRIRSTIGGVEFPDGSVQATAASAAAGNPVDLGAFGPVATATIAVPFSSVSAVGGTWMGGGYSGETTYVSVINVGGVWKYAVLQVSGGNTSSGSGTLTTGVASCPVGGVPDICITRTAANTLALRTSNSGGSGGPRYIYTVYGP